MNQVTNKITFYIIVIFATIFLIVGSFFVYKIYFSGAKELDYNTLAIDEEFKKKLEQIEKDRLERLKNKEVEYYQDKEAPCFIDDKEYPDGSKAVFYARTSVGAYESCADFSTEKTCDNAFWLGDKAYKYTTCKRSVDCKISATKTIENGEKIYLYSRDRVQFGDDCERYKGERVCKESVLTGNRDYIYENCKVVKDGVCRVKDNQGIEHIIPNERARVFYSTPTVAYNDLCENYAKSRMCSGGVIYGDEKYKYWDCQKEEPKDCNINGVTIPHGSNRTLYSKTSASGTKSCRFYSQIRECQDGVLSGQEEYIHPTCSD